MCAVADFYNAAKSLRPLIQVATSISGSFNYIVAFRLTRQDTAPLELACRMHEFGCESMLDFLFHLLPLYWHADEPNRRKHDRRYLHLIPLYGHDQSGDYHDRYFLLFPLAMVAFDRQTERPERDVLFPLFHHQTDLNGSQTRLIPSIVPGKAGETTADIAM